MAKNKRKLPNKCRYCNTPIVSNAVVCNGIECLRKRTLENIKNMQKRQVLRGYCIFCNDKKEVNLSPFCSLECEEKYILREVVKSTLGNNKIDIIDKLQKLAIEPKEQDLEYYKIIYLNYLKCNNVNTKKSIPLFWAFRYLGFDKKEAKEIAEYFIFNLKDYSLDTQVELIAKYSHIKRYSDEYSS